MEYIFGVITRKGKTFHSLKTIGKQPTTLKGHVIVKRQFSNNEIVDDFIINEHFMSKEDEAGNYYNWYILKDHSRYIDYFTPLKEQITEGIADSQVATCELSEELDERITDVEVAICELSEILEGGE